MNHDHPALRRGKSVAVRLAVDAAVAAGKKGALCSIGADGEAHVCVVQSIERARKESQ